MSEFFDIIKQVLIPVCYKESQVTRGKGNSSLKNNKKFKKKLFDSIMKLSKKADSLNLTNKDIRRKIMNLSKEANVSIGQSQKVINVYLKFYCIITNKPLSIIKELDCPLDSQIMSTFKTKNLRKTPLKKLNDFDEYVAWQNHLENIGNGIRLRPDIEAYDKKRINSFLS